MTTQKFLRQEIFGIEKYFGWGVETRTMIVQESTDKDAVLEGLASWASQLGVARRLRAGLRVVADELLTNALYNAPTDPDGTPRFAHWPRTRAVRLPRSEAIEVRYCCDGRRLGLSVTDPFGSLAPEQVQDNLARALSRGQDQIREGAGGAGLGLFQVLDALSHFIINLEPGTRTEMIGLLEVGGSYRDFAESPRSFNVFVKGSAQ